MEIPYLFDIPRVSDPRGNLSFLQDGSIIPFDIQRVYWIYDVPAGEERGSHAHIEGRSVIIAVGGSFNVKLYDGREWRDYALNRPYQGLYVPAGYWRTLDNFSSGSVCLCLTSTLFSEEDYIREFDDYMNYIRTVRHHS